MMHPKRRALLGLLALLLLAALQVQERHDRLFGTFLPYDDEGLIALDLHHYQDGAVLYDAVQSAYGPFHFFFWSALLKVVSLSPDTDGLRLLVIGLWSLTALLSGVYVHRLTQNLGAALLGQAAVHALLIQYTHEPGHPQAFANVLILAGLLAATVARERWGWAAAGLGLVAGLLTMTKVNIGAFLVGAVLLALAAAGREAAFARLRGFGLLAAAVLPGLVMKGRLDEPWAFRLCLVASATILGVALLARRGVREAFVERRHVAAFLGVAALVSVGVAAATLSAGTSLASLVHGVLLRHQTRGFHIALDPSPWNVAAALGSLMLASCAALPWPPSAQARRGGLMAMRAAFAAGVLVAAVLGRADWILTWLAPFSWTVVAAPRDEDRERPCDFDRLLLACVASLQTLLVFPVAGSQTVFATVWMVPLAAVALSDSWRAGRGPTLARLDTAVAGAFCVLALTVTGSGWLEARTWQSRNLPLDLPGARRLRLAEFEVATFRWVARNLGAHCDDIVMLPGMDSFYLWSARPAPSPLVTDHTWFFWLTPSEQDALVARLARGTRTCAVRQRELMAFWLRGGQDVSTSAALHYVDRALAPRASFLGYELLMAPGRAAEPLFAVRRLPGGAGTWELSLPAAFVRDAARIQVVAAAGVIADTAGKAGPLLRRSGVALQLEPDGRVSRGTHGPELIRLLDAQGRWLDSVPVVEPP